MRHVPYTSQFMAQVIGQSIEEETMIRHESNLYRLEEHRRPFSFTLTRLSDGYNMFFQGNDADQWDRDMNALEKIENWHPGNSFDRAFNFTCDTYDDILGPFEVKRLG